MNPEKSKAESGRVSALLTLFFISLFMLSIAHAQQTPIEATPQRPTFTNDAATTAPGTLELDFGATGPASGLTLPTTFKITPPVEGGFFHQMEFALGFDLLERVPRVSGSEIKFGDSLDLVVRRPVWSNNELTFAVAPSAEFFLRDNEGAVLGVKGIMVYGFGLNGLVLNVLGKGATDPSDDNPGWVAEVAGGYNRTLSGTGTAGKFSVAFEALSGFSKGQDATFSLLQAINFRVQPNLVLDLAVEQRGLRAGDFEMVLQGGLTYNVGRIWSR